MLKEFQDYIAEYHMLKPESRVLLAVSGGIDSMVMAHLFRSAGIECGIAHCNFSLRGKESDMDEELVKCYAEKNSLPYHSVKFNTKTFASENGLSVQMAARELRYKWFEEIRDKNGYESISVAHNLNDNIETFLINIIRGTGITGLTGISPVNGRIIRPLLFATRSDIEKYCRKNKILFREDRSNAETKYTRNKIRHLVIPVMKEINPAFEKTLSETIVRLRGSEEIVERYISGIRDIISVSKGESVSFDAEYLKKHSRENTLLFELFKPYGLSGNQLDDLADVIKGTTGGQLFTNSHRILKDRRKIIVSNKKELTDNYFRIEIPEDFVSVPWIESADFVDITSDFTIPCDRMTACLDSRKLSFPIIIRRWKKGDYFYPLGMESKKKLSDYFVDRKLSLIDKDNIMILESEGEIAWIIGERIDNRFRIKPTTTRALIIKLNY